MIAAVVAGLARFACGPAVSWQCDPDSARQRIYFANHSSHLDFVVLWASLPAAQRRRVRPVAGRDYWEKTAVRRYLARAVFRAILVQRTDRGQSSIFSSARARKSSSDPTGTRKSSSDPGAAGADGRAAAAKAAVDAMAREMGTDTSLIVFPEGTRSGNGELGPFKSGLYHLARAAPGAELVPVYLHNLNRILPRGEALPVPMLSRVSFGAPLHPDPGEPKERFLERARSTLLALKED